jgi:hypothetical protein
MRKKMKNMSADEKMKMAMEMMKGAGKPADQSDPPAVRSVLDEWQKVYNTAATEFQRSVDLQQQDLKFREADEKAHAGIDKWEAAEITMLPPISSGEMSAPDPAKVKVVKLQANDRHIAVAEKRLRQIGESWRAYAAHDRSRYSTFYQKLVASEYASGTTNFPTIKILSDAQMMILKDISHLVSVSRTATEEAARWLAVRKDIEEK